MNGLCHDYSVSFYEIIFLFLSSCPSLWTGNRCNIIGKPITTTTPFITDSKLGKQDTGV